MEDEKELIIKIRNSLKNKKTTAQITKTLQKKGFSLEYAEALTKKAKMPKKIFWTSIIVLIVLASISLAVFTAIYPIFTEETENHSPLSNPLKDYNIIFNGQGDNNESKTNISIEELEITEEFIEYILIKLNATNLLHKNPITRENPIINFKIEEKEYTAELDGKVIMSIGLSSEADIQFNSNKKTIAKSILSENPAQVFRDSVAVEGTTTIEKIAGDTELFAKGYLSLYEEFK
jgi:flagellar basal body-associated protein FliL